MYGVCRVKRYLLSVIIKSLKAEATAAKEMREWTGS